MVMTKEGIDKRIDYIFWELYEGLECDSQEEYNEIEKLYEQYFRPALHNARDKFLKESNSNIIKDLMLYRDSHYQKNTHLASLYKSLVDYYMEEQRLIWQTEEKYDNTDAARARERLYSHLDSIEFAEDFDDDFDENKPWIESSTSKFAREEMLKRIDLVQQRLKEKLTNSAVEKRKL